MSTLTFKRIAFLAVCLCLLLLPAGNAVAQESPPPLPEVMRGMTWIPGVHPAVGQLVGAPIREMLGLAEQVRIMEELLKEHGLWEDFCLRTGRAIPESSDTPEIPKSKHRAGS